MARFEGVLLNERVSYEIALFRMQGIVAAFSIGCFEIVNTSFALTRFLIFSLLLLFPMAWGQGGLPASLKPIRQDAEWAVNWWMPRHEEKLAEAKERGDEVDLLLVGDSITHYWAEDCGLNVMVGAMHLIWASAAIARSMYYGELRTEHFGIWLRK